MKNTEKITGEARRSVIIRTSLIGIGSNLLLSGFKAAIGLISGSIAILMDAVNNLSDALSSVITIIGTKLAMRRPDREHPLGHGRYEYIAAEIISAVILYAGITSFVESVKKIISPQTPDYSPVSLIIVGSAVLVKILLGTFVKKQGERVNSDSLRDSGKDALFDAVISASTLLAAVIFLIFGWSLEAWLGALISIYIIKSGIDMFRETMSRILGERVDSELSQAIKETIGEIPGISGAYDLILHSYGPESYFGSAHIELDEKMTVAELDALTRRIVPKVYADCGVLLTLGVYAANNDAPDAKAIRAAVQTAVSANPMILQMHGFYLSETDKAVSFDLVFDYSQEHPEQVIASLKEALSAQFPDYQFTIHLDRDFSVSD